MKYIDKPYISENIKLPRWVIRRFWRHKLLPGIYVLRTARGSDELEIIRADYYRQSFIRREDSYIVGFAADYSDACKMVVQLVEEAVEKLGRPAIKEYLLNDINNNTYHT